jgi:hypothetical protein
LGSNYRLLESTAVTSEHALEFRVLSPSLPQVERLRRELGLLQRLATGARRAANAAPAEEDLSPLVAENEDLRRRLRQSEGDCQLSMCELEAALAQVDALEPTELRGHEAELLAARQALRRTQPPGAAVPPASPAAPSETAESATPDASESTGTSSGSVPAIAAQWVGVAELAAAPPREAIWTA